MPNVAAALMAWALHVGILAVLCGPFIWWSLRRRARRLASGTSASGGAATTRGSGVGAGHSADQGATGLVAHEVASSEPGFRPRLLVAAALIHLVILVLLMSPKLDPFDGLELNWQGQLLALVFSVALIFGWRQLSPTAVGLTRPHGDAWRIVIVGTIGAVVIQFAVGGMGPWRAPTAESLLHAATMPGLLEELLFRGILWFLVVQALPGRRQVAGLNVTWAMVITSLLFGLAHGVLVDPVEGLQVDLGYLFFSGVSGVLFVWLRERSGSIIPAMVLHNTINLSGLLVFLVRG